MTSAHFLAETIQKKEKKLHDNWWIERPIIFYKTNRFESILVANWNALVVATGRRAIDVSWRSEEE